MLRWEASPPAAPQHCFGPLYPADALANAKVRQMAGEKDCYFTASCAALLDDLEATLAEDATLSFTRMESILAPFRAGPAAAAFSALVKHETIRRSLDWLVSFQAGQQETNLLRLSGIFEMLSQSDLNYDDPRTAQALISCETAFHDLILDVCSTDEDEIAMNILNPMLETLNVCRADQHMPGYVAENVSVLIRAAIKIFVKYVQNERLKTVALDQVIDLHERIVRCAKGNSRKAFFHNLQVVDFILEYSIKQDVLCAVISEATTLPSWVEKCFEQRMPAIFDFCSKNRSEGQGLGRSKFVIDGQRLPREVEIFLAREGQADALLSWLCSAMSPSADAAWRARAFSVALVCARQLGVAGIPPHMQMIARELVAGNFFKLAQNILIQDSFGEGAFQGTEQEESMLLVFQGPESAAEQREDSSGFDSDEDDDEDVPQLLLPDNCDPVQPACTKSLLQAGQLTSIYLSQGQESHVLTIAPRLEPAVGSEIEHPRSADENGPLGFSDHEMYMDRACEETARQSNSGAGASDFESFLGAMQAETTNQDTKLENNRSSKLRIFKDELQQSMIAQVDLGTSSLNAGVVVRLDTRGLSQIWVELESGNDLPAISVIIAQNMDQAMSNAQSNALSCFSQRFQVEFSWELFIAIASKLGTNCWTSGECLAARNAAMERMEGLLDRAASKLIDKRRGSSRLLYFVLRLAFALAPCLDRHVVEEDDQHVISRLWDAFCTQLWAGPQWSWDWNLDENVNASNLRTTQDPRAINDSLIRRQENWSCAMHQNLASAALATAATMSGVTAAIIREMGDESPEEDHSSSLVALGMLAGSHFGYDDHHSGQGESLLFQARSCRDKHVELLWVCEFVTHAASMSQLARNEHLEHLLRLGLGTAFPGICSGVRLTALGALLHLGRKGFAAYGSFLKHHIDALANASCDPEMHLALRMLLARLADRCLSIERSQGCELSDSAFQQLASNENLNTKKSGNWLPSLICALLSESCCNKPERAEALVKSPAWNSVVNDFEDIDAVLRSRVCRAAVSMFATCESMPRELLPMLVDKQCSTMREQIISQALAQGGPGAEAVINAVLLKDETDSECGPSIEFIVEYLATASNVHEETQRKLEAMTIQGMRSSNSVSGLVCDLYRSAQQSPLLAQVVKANLGLVLRALLDSKGEKENDEHDYEQFEEPQLTQSIDLIMQDFAGLAAIAQEGPQNDGKSLLESLLDFWKRQSEWNQALAFTKSWISSVNLNSLRCSVSRVFEWGAILKLDLGDNCVGDAGATIVAGWLADNSCAMQDLSLRRNGVGPRGTCHIADALRCCPSLTRLDLSENDIAREEDGTGVIALAEALVWNTTLATLDISANSISAASARPLVHALRYNGALQRLGTEYCGGGTSVFDNGAVAHRLSLNVAGVLQSPHLIQSKLSMLEARKNLQSTLSDKEKDQTKVTMNLLTNKDWKIKGRGKLTLPGGGGQCRLDEQERKDEDESKEEVNEIVSNNHSDPLREQDVQQLEAEIAALRARESQLRLVNC